jgi:hypothetical protein
VVRSSLWAYYLSYAGLIYRARIRRLTCHGEGESALTSKASAVSAGVRKSCKMHEVSAYLSHPTTIDEVQNKKTDLYGCVLCDKI